MLKSNRSITIFLCIVYFIALFIRVGIIYYTRNSPEIGLTYQIGEAARNLSAGRGYVVDDEYLATIIDRMYKTNRLVEMEDVPPPDKENFTPYYGLPPGTSSLVALTFSLSGEYRYIYTRILQAILDSFGCLIIFLLCRQLFSKRVGLIASFTYAVFLPIATLSTFVIHDALMPFFILVSLYFFIKGVLHDKLVFYLLSSLFIGVSCYFQPTALFLPCLYGLALLIYKLRKREIGHQLANTIKITAAMMLVVMVMTVPWIVRNYYVTGVLSPNMRVGTWAGIWVGFGEFQDNPAGAIFNEAYAWELAKKELGYDVKFGTPEYDLVFKDKVITTITEHPLWWLKALLLRLPRTLFYYNGLGIQPLCPDYQNWYECEGRQVTWANFLSAWGNGTFLQTVISYPYQAFYWSLAAVFVVFPVLFSVGGIWVLRKDWRKVVLIITPVVYLSAVHIVCFVSGVGKSLLPGSLAYIILSAVFIDHLFNRGKPVDNDKPAALANLQ
ncbi:MAG: glycosyltransferase family 39 protein [Dehalococcoidia bacterium]|nr:glycosyltransferase family 39 protein [Dehalococcoidia bacterium]MDD5493147.1 glycosyltransferase family 39 protein [Dehalococcoidia bacterium]